MGSIVQKQPQSPLFTLCSSTNQTFSLQRCSKTVVLPNGMIIVTMEGGTSGLLYQKLLMQSSKKEVAQKWARTVYRHSCNILHFEAKTQSMLCSAHTTITAIVEYGNHSLAQILDEKDSNNLMILDKSQTAATERTVNTSIEMLQLVKCLIEATQEHFNLRNQWINFHTGALIYFRQLKAFKYLYIPQLDGVLERETFFDPYQSSFPGSKPAQSSTVFSIGMILMSLLLKDDCSSCYNFQNLSFCWSIFEQNKDKVKELMLSKASNEMSYSRIGSSLEEDICSLTLAALASTQYRVSFVQIKKLYFRLLRKTGTSGKSPYRDIINRPNIGDQLSKKHYSYLKDEVSNKENNNNENIQRELQDFSSSFTITANISSIGLHEEQKLQYLKKLKKVPRRGLELKKPRQSNLI